MSDLSEGERLARVERAAPRLPWYGEASDDGWRFRRLHTASEIASVLPLRESIPLAAGVREDPAFVELEKKGTTSVWSEHSSGGGSWSVP